MVVVAGETGSGKTTQLPKICLELGRGIRGTIGHTQPRRLAARTVAQRIADELGTPLGEAVGYTVRFNDHASDRTLVKLMTDGILLAEIQRDRRLLRYDTLILDEAHERSLNIDFLLGYLRELLPRRPDLKVIVTSATIEPGRFAAHFGGPDGAAPDRRGVRADVSGRNPLPPTGSRRCRVDRRRRSRRPRPRDRSAPRCATRPRRSSTPSRELEAEPPGDVLVFLSGEREIRDTAEALRDALDEHRGAAAVRAAADRRAAEGVRSRTTGRRVVLATNVAETSLTVPGIRYVVDPGTARISRYSRRTKVQRLPIEPISQASAAQRAGRSGRIAPGVCIRLYSEEDFESRPRYTDPEILRTNLAAVILQMAALRTRRHRGLPVPRPARRSAASATACNCCSELGAFDADGAITDLGRRLAQLPLDPRIGRMILAADAEGCVREVLVLAAALSIPDPRERPDRPGGGRAAEARPVRRRALRLHAPTSTSGATSASSERTLSGSAFRRMCRDGVPALPAHPGVAGPHRPAAQHRPRPRHPRERRPRTRRPGAGARRAARGAAVARRAARGRRAGSMPGARNSKFVLAPGLGADQEAAALGRRRRPGGDQPAVRPDRGAHRTRGRRARRRAIWCSAPTASRTGTPSAAR